MRRYNMAIMKQFSLFDTETGDIISSHQQLAGSQLKEGWIVVYKEALRDLMAKCPNYATLRTYLYIATAQNYDTVTLITIKYIASETGMRYQTVWNSVKWLINEGFIAKANIKGSPGFVVNPLVSTCGKKNYDEKLEYFAKDLASVLGIDRKDVEISLDSD